MTAPVGAIVSLYVDLVAPVGSGDIIETQTGRRYSVIAVRVQARGKHAGRQHLRAIVADADAAPDEMVYAGPDGETRDGAVHRVQARARSAVKRRNDPIALARELLASLGQTPDAANDDTPVIDEAALQARAEKAAERMRRARKPVRG